MNTTFYCVPKDSDLMHYGVKGMKWGVRREEKPYISLRTRRLKSSISSYDKDIKDFNTGYVNKKGKTIISDKDAKSIQKALIKDRNKLQTKLIKSQYRDSYMSGKNAVQRFGIRITGSDKIYADTMYNLDKKHYD